MSRVSTVEGIAGRLPSIVAAVAANGRTVGHAVIDMHGDGEIRLLIWERPPRVWAENLLRDIGGEPVTYIPGTEGEGDHVSGKIPGGHLVVIALAR